MQGVQWPLYLRVGFGSRDSRTPAVQAGVRTTSPWQPPTGQVTMSSRSLRAGALLALTAATALLDHSVADARRLETTVVVGRVTSNGRAVAGVTVSIAGRTTTATSTSDGR